jgi:hypothetical protein
VTDNTKKATTCPIGGFMFLQCFYGYLIGVSILFYVTKNYLKIQLSMLHSINNKRKKKNYFLFIYFFLWQIKKKKKKTQHNTTKNYNTFVENIIFLD